MSKLSQQAEGIMAQIDGLVTMIERHELSLDIFPNLSFSMSPISFLLEILHHIGVTYDEIAEWLSDLLMTTTPIIEIAVKGVLISKLKSNIDCNLDPRIPKYLRENIGGCTSLDELNGSTKFYIMINDKRYDVNDNKIKYGDSSYTVEKNSDGKDVVKIGDDEFIVYEEKDELLMNGVDIDISSIDFNGLLNNSPMSDRSQYLYFGTKKKYTVEGINNSNGTLESYASYEEIVKKCLKKGIDTNLIKKTSEIDSVYELARAKDMNAFLWFILNKAKFLNVSDVNRVMPDTLYPPTILSEITGVTNVSESDNMVSLGGCYVQSNGSNESTVMGLCIKNTPIRSFNGEIKENSTSNSGFLDISDINIGHKLYKLNDNITGYEYTIVPTTNVWNGCNWYVNRSLYFDFWNLKKRDYNKEFALFRLVMKDQDGVATNKLTFTIKPAPNIIIPNFNVDVYHKKTEKDKWLNFKYSGSTPWSFHKILFDVDGKKDVWGGKYSVVVDESVTPTRDGKYNVYTLLNPKTKDQIQGISLYVNMLSGEYKLVTKGCQDIRMPLYECYPGLTVYEFNYDFIMGMRFYDPTVVAAQLIEALTNIRLGFSVTKTQTEYQMRISEIVKKLLETNGYESSDCFFSFSNDTFNRMQEKSELKRANLYPFQDEGNRAFNVKDADVYSVLNDYDSEATLEENISVVNRAITSATATISNEVYPEDKYNCEFDLITKGVEMITSIFVEALLSPKMLLVFAVNQKIMGEEMPKNLNIEKLLESFLDIIIAMVSEIIEMIIKKLLDFVMEKVKSLLSAAAKILLLEQLNYYTSLIRQMLENCAFSLPKNPNLVSTLDNVDYADIDANDKPITNEC